MEVDIISEELASRRKDLEPEEQERCLEKGEISHNETSEHPQTEEKMVLDRENEEVSDYSDLESEPFSDDSIVDPNYETDSTTTTDRENEVPLQQEAPLQQEELLQQEAPLQQDEEEANATKKKIRKRKKEPKDWRRNKTKNSEIADRHMSHLTNVDL